VARIAIFFPESSMARSLVRDEFIQSTSANIVPESARLP